MHRLSSNSKATIKIDSKGIDKAKKDYFDRVFVAYKSDIKKTWQVISETLSRNQKSHEMPSVFDHEGDELADSVKIANAFNTYRHKLIKVILMSTTSYI